MKRGSVLVLIILAMLSVNALDVFTTSQILSDSSITDQTEFICANDCDIQTNKLNVENVRSQCTQWVEKNSESDALCVSVPNSCLFIETDFGSLITTNNVPECTYGEPRLHLESRLTDGNRINDQFNFSSSDACFYFCENYNQPEVQLSGTIQIPNSDLVIDSTNAKVSIGPFLANVENNQYTFTNIKQMQRANLQVVPVGTNFFEPYEIQLDLSTVNEHNIDLTARESNLITKFFDFVDSQSIAITDAEGSLTLDNSITYDIIAGVAFSIPNLDVAVHSISVVLNGYLPFVNNSVDVQDDVNAIKLGPFESIDNARPITITVIEQGSDALIRDAKVSIGDYTSFTGLNGQTVLNIPDTLRNQIIVSKQNYESKSIDLVDSNVYRITLTPITGKTCTPGERVNNINGNLYTWSYLQSTNQVCQKDKAYDIDNENIVNGIDYQDNAVENPSSSDYICCSQLISDNVPDKLKDTDSDLVPDYIDVCPNEPAIQSTLSKHFRLNEISDIKIDGLSICSDGIDNDCDDDVDLEDSACVECNEADFCSTDTSNTKNSCSVINGVKQFNKSDVAEFANYCSFCGGIDPDCVVFQPQDVDYQCCNYECADDAYYTAANSDALCPQTPFTCQASKCPIVDVCIEGRTFGDIVEAGIPNSISAQCGCGSKVYSYNDVGLQTSCCIDGVLSTECEVPDVYKLELNLFETTLGVTKEYGNEIDIFLRPGDENEQITNPFSIIHGVGNTYTVVGLQRQNYLVEITASNKKPFVLPVTTDDFDSAQRGAPNEFLIVKDVFLEPVFRGKCSESEPTAVFTVSAIKGSANANITIQNPCIESNETGLVSHYVIRRTHIDDLDVNNYEEFLQNNLDINASVFPTDIFGETVAIIKNDQIELDLSKCSTDTQDNRLDLNCAQLDSIGNAVYKNNITFVDTLNNWGIAADGKKNSYLYEVRVLYSGNRMSAFTTPESINDFRKEYEQNTHSFTNNKSTHLAANVYNQDNVYRKETQTINTLKDELLFGTPAFVASQSNFLDSLNTKFFSSGSAICEYYAGEFCGEYLDENLAISFQGLLNDDDFSGFNNVFTKKQQMELARLEWSNKNFEKLYEDNNFVSIPSTIVTCNEFNFPTRIDQTEDSICTLKKAQTYSQVCAINPTDSLDAECVVLPDIEYNKDFRTDLLDDNQTGSLFSKDELYNTRKDIGRNIEVDTNIFAVFDKGTSVYDKWFSCTDSFLDDTSRAHGCYGYRSQDACESNVCGYGFENNCNWVDAGFVNGNELSTGYCADSKPIENNCALCDPSNDVQGYGVCSQDVCSSLGDCYSSFDSNSEFTYCSECTVNTKCEDYASEAACTGGNANNVASEQITLLFGTGEFNVSAITNRGSDICGLGTCSWRADLGCFEDKNGDGEKDSEPSNSKVKTHLLQDNNLVYKINTTDWPSEFISHKDSTSYVSSIERDLSTVVTKTKSGIKTQPELSDFASVLTINSNTSTSLVDSNKNLIEIDDSIFTITNAQLVDTQYYSVLSDGLVENQKITQLLIDNTKPEVSITINKLNEGAGPYDIRIKRTVNEQTFDSMGNPNACDSELVQINFGSDNVSYPAPESNNTYTVGVNEYQADATYEYNSLPKGVYKFSSKCYDLAGNYQEDEKRFVLGDDTFIKYRYPNPGVYLGPDVTFGVELFRNAKECVYNLNFKGQNQVINSQDGSVNNLFNKKWNISYIDYLADENGDLFREDGELRYTQVPVDCDQSGVGSRACRTDEKGLYLESQYTTANYTGQGITSFNYRNLRSGLVVVNATCLIQNGTDATNYEEKEFIVTAFYIDQLPPITTIATKPREINTTRGWINYQNLVDGNGKLIVEFNCTDQGPAGGVAGCFPSSDYQVHDYGAVTCDEFAQGSILRGTKTTIDSSSTICFRSKDVLGNTEDVKKVEFQIDTELPELNLTSISGLDIIDDQNVYINNYIFDGRFVPQFRMSEQTTNLTLFEAYKLIDDEFVLVGSTNIAGTSSFIYSFDFAADDNLNVYKFVAHDYAGNKREKIYNFMNDKTAPSIELNVEELRFTYGQNITFDVFVEDNTDFTNFRNYDVEEKFDVNYDELVEINLTGSSLNTNPINQIAAGLNSRFESGKVSTPLSNYLNYTDQMGDFRFVLQPVDLGGQFSGIKNIIPGLYNLSIYAKDNYSNENVVYVPLTIDNDPNLITSQDLEIKLFDETGVQNLVTRNSDYTIELSSTKLLSDIVRIETSLIDADLTSYARKTNGLFANVVSSNGLLIVSDQYQTPNRFNDIADIRLDDWGNPLSGNNSNFVVEVKDIFGFTHVLIVDDRISVDMKAPTDFEFVPSMLSTVEVWEDENNPVLNRLRKYEPEYYDQFGLITNDLNFYVSGQVDNYLTTPEIYYKTDGDYLFDSLIEQVNEPNRDLNYNVFVNREIDYFKQNNFNIDFFDQELVDLYFDEGSYHKSNLMEYPQITQVTTLNNGLNKNIRFDALVQNDYRNKKLSIYAKPNRHLSFANSFNLNDLFASSTNMPFDTINTQATSYNFDLKATDRFNNVAPFLKTGQRTFTDGFRVTYDPIDPVVEIEQPNSGQFLTEEITQFKFTIQDNIAIDTIDLIVRANDGAIVIQESLTRADIVDNELILNYDNTTIVEDGSYSYNLTVWDLAGNEKRFENIQFNVLRSAPRLLNFELVNANEFAGVHYINNEKNPELIVNLNFDNPNFDFVYNFTNVKLIDLNTNNVINNFASGNQNEYAVSFASNTAPINGRNRLNYTLWNDFYFHVDYRDLGFDFTARKSGLELSEGEYALEFTVDKGLNNGFGNFDFASEPVQGIYTLNLEIDNTDPEIDLFNLNKTNTLDFDLMGINREKNLMNFTPVDNLSKIDSYLLAENEGFVFPATLVDVVNDMDEVLVPFKLLAVDKALNSKEFEGSIIYDLRLPVITFNVTSKDGFNNTVDIEDGIFYTNNEHVNVEVTTDEPLISSLTYYDDGLFFAEELDFTTFDDSSILTGKEIKPFDFIPLRDFEDVDIIMELVGIDSANNLVAGNARLVVDHTAPIISNLTPLSIGSLRPTFTFNTNEQANCTFAYQKPLALSSQFVDLERISGIFNKSHEFMPSENIIQDLSIQQLEPLNIEFNLSITCNDRRGNKDTYDYVAKLDFKTPDYDVRLERGTCINNDYCQGLDIKKYNFETGDIINNEVTNKLLIYNNNKPLSCSYIDLKDLANTTIDYKVGFDTQSLTWDYDIYSSPFSLPESDEYLAAEQLFDDNLRNNLLNKKLISDDWIQITNDIQLVLAEDSVDNYLINCKDEAGNYGYPKLIRAGADFDGPVGIFFDQPIYTNDINYNLRFITRKDASCTVSRPGVSRISVGNQNEDFEFENVVPLNLDEGDGLYTFDINCDPTQTFSRGTSGSEQVEINLDTQAPIIEITSPRDIVTFNSIYNLQFNVNDNSNEFTVVEIAKPEYENIFELDSDKTVNIDIPLELNENRIEISATDRAGNQAVVRNVVTRIIDQTRSLASALIETPGDGAILNDVDVVSALYLSEANSRPVDMTNSLLFIRNMNTGQIIGDAETRICSIEANGEIITQNSLGYTRNNIMNGDWSGSIIVTPGRIYQDTQTFEGLNLYGDFMDFSSSLFRIELTPSEPIILNNFDLANQTSIQFLDKEFELTFESSGELFKNVGFILTDSDSGITNTQKIVAQNPYGVPNIVESNQNYESTIQLDATIDGLNNTVLRQIVYTVTPNKAIRLKKGDLLSLAIGDSQRDQSSYLSNIWDFRYEGIEGGFAPRIGVDDTNLFRDYYVIDPESTSNAQLDNLDHNVEFITYVESCSPVSHTGGTISTSSIRKELSLSDLDNGLYSATAIPLDFTSKAGIPASIVFEIDDSVPTIKKVFPNSLLLNNKQQKFLHNVSANRIKSSSFALNDQVNPSSLITISNGKYIHDKNLELNNGRNYYELRVTDQLDNTASTGREVYLVNDQGFVDPNIIVSNVDNEFDVATDCSFQCRLEPELSRQRCLDQCLRFENDDLVQILEQYGLSSKNRFVEKESSYSEDVKIRNLLSNYYNTAGVIVSTYIDYSDFRAIELTEFAGDIQELIIDRQEDANTINFGNAQVNNLRVQDLDENGIIIKKVDYTLVYNNGTNDQTLQMTDYLKDDKFYSKKYFDLLSGVQFDRFRTDIIDGRFNYRVKFVD